MAIDRINMVVIEVKFIRFGIKFIDGFFIFVYWDNIIYFFWMNIMKMNIMIIGILIMKNYLNVIVFNSF